MPLRALRPGINRTVLPAIVIAALDVRIAVLLGSVDYLGILSHSTAAGTVRTGTRHAD